MEDDKKTLLEKRIKRRGKWTGIAVFLFIIWLLILMYMFFVVSSRQDTIKPSESVPTVVDESELAAGTINIKEYIVKTDSISPEYTGDIWLPPNDDGGSQGYEVCNLNVADLTAYSATCSVTYNVLEGDDNFSAKSIDGVFTSADKTFDSFTGSTVVTPTNHITNDDGDTAMAINKELGTTKWIKLFKNAYIDSNIIKGVAVIVSDDSQVANGVSTLGTRLNELNDCGMLGGASGGRFPSEAKYTINNFTLEEFANFVGECFHTKGYTISSAGEGEINFSATSTGGISIESSDLKDGDTLIFISTDRIDINPRTAGQYSKIQSGTFEGTVLE